MTSLQGDYVVNKILYFFCVWGFFLCVSNLSKWRTGMNANWEKKDGLCQLFCTYFYPSGSILCPVIYIDLCLKTIAPGISCPMASCWFHPIGGTTKRKRVGGQSYSALISATSQFPPSQPMILTVVVFLIVCSLLSCSPSPTATAITRFWYNHFLSLSHQVLK